MTAGWRRHLAVLLALLLVAVACRRATSPEEALARAFEDTFDASFAYELTLAADAAALASLGAEGAQAATFLRSLKVAGRVDGDRVVLAVAVLGIDAFEFVSLGRDRIYFRVGAIDLLALAGAGTGDLAREVAPRLLAAGLPAAVEEAILSALRGDWVGIEGEFDGERIAALLGRGAEDAELDERAADVLGGDLRGFISRYTTVGAVREEGAARVYEVRFELGPLLEGLAQVGAGDPTDRAQVPASVPGTVTVEDGRVTLLTADLAAAAREAGEEVDGSVELRLAFTDHGRVAPVEAPAGAAIVTAADLEAALARIVGERP